MSGPKRQLSIGYAPLNDAAPLIMAHELGLFGEFGLDVRLQRQSSWATARDLLTIGALDASHMLAPVTLATQNEHGDPAIFTPLVLSLCGNSIVVSRTLFADMLNCEPRAGADVHVTARALASIAVAKRKAGGPLLKFGVVFRQSNHLFDLRRLLRAGGADPDTDLSLAVVPPQETERFLEQGLLDGFSAGEPWGSHAVSRGFGVIVASGKDLWPNRIDKVLAFPVGFESRQPDIMLRMMQAVMAASVWLDDSALNRRAAAGILVDGGYIDLPADTVQRGLMGRIERAPNFPPQQDDDYVVFNRYGAGFPWHSQGHWLAKELQSLGAIKGGDISQLVTRAFRTDIYRQAATASGLASPIEDFKPEAQHDQNWQVPSQRVGLDGITCDEQIVMAPDRRFEDEMPI
jgi:two-component system, oxyanion-binding sensor